MQKEKNRKKRRKRKTGVVVVEALLRRRFEIARVKSCESEGRGVTLANRAEDEVRDGEGIYVSTHSGVLLVVAPRSSLRTSARNCAKKLARRGRNLCSFCLSIECRSSSLNSSEMTSCTETSSCWTSSGVVGDFRMEIERRGRVKRTTFSNRRSLRRARFDSIAGTGRINRQKERDDRFLQMNATRNETNDF